MFPKKTAEEFVAQMQKKFGTKYELVGRFGNMNTRTTFKDTETGETFEKAPVDLMRMA